MLDRCHLKLVWTQIHERDLQPLKLLSNSGTSMVWSIVNHNHSLQPPIILDGIHVIAELDDKVNKGIPISLTLIDCIEELASIRDASNDVDRAQPPTLSDLIILPYD